MTEYDGSKEEVKIWGRINHQNIVKVFFFYETKDKMYVTMQLADLGQIATYDTTEKTFILN
jgi:hypothetical protein